MNTSQKPGIHDCCLVKRRLKLDVPSRGTISTIRDALDSLPTVDSASVSRDGRGIDIAYDASKESLDHVLEIVGRNGGELADGWWMRCKAGWYRYIDQNVKANQAAGGYSCHNLPPAVRSGGRPR